MAPPLSKPSKAAGSSAPVAAASVAITNPQTFCPPETGISRTLTAWKWGFPRAWVQSPNTLGNGSNRAAGRIGLPLSSLLRAYLSFVIATIHLSAVTTSSDSSQQALIKNLMKQSKKPLSGKERLEIWVSFWMHALMALVAAFLSPIFINEAVTDRGLHNILWFLLFSGLPTFLIWAHYVLKIEKYKASTGISYPSTYIVLAIASALLMVGPLVLFFSLLIRMSNVPRLETSRESSENPTIRDPSPEPRSASLSQQATTPPATPETPSDREKVIAQGRNIAPKPSPPKTIMKPKPEQRLSALPFIDDEPFYEEVAKELETETIKPGLWTKALADADGDKERVKPIYIRLRVAQLLAAKEAELRELQRLEDERIRAEEEAAKKEAARQEAARKEAARKEAELIELQRLEDERIRAEEEVAKKEAARAEAARIEAARLEAAEQERAEKDPIYNRQKTMQRIKREFGNRTPYPAKVSIHRTFVYFFKKYDLILGSDAILFISHDIGTQADILVMPKLGDHIKFIICIDVDAEIEMADGTFLRVQLPGRSKKALKEWLKNLR